ncbi:hypothetical protein ED312_17000 [Sinomicrobium pectinilyticum]|uniref:Uncharacterized protein n=1 Tax=Sinomicrobium pectinilyticum TaxID=1084421 RepID=A0A3N0E3T1_SINP1|nr:hypothetical protein [Sinomicrobium pectinilyticum]RNL82495.1 hypothetical protein ED312_17000 [Sinomicrobium pectinilyticum]
MTKSLVFFLVAVLYWSMGQKTPQDPIRYFRKQTINRPIAGVKARTVSLEEEMPNDSLFQHLSADGVPVYYTREVKTAVCFDNKCRQLVITLFWNPTGRYLGFELPENEFLSKKDHDPFTDKEYQRLNELLADPDLPLGKITFNELVLTSTPLKGELDGVSGATSENLLQYVIEGAAYTTYKLYTILYGPTQQLVRDWTMQCWGKEFMLEVIRSNNLYDVFWGLENVKGKLKEYPRLQEQVLDMIRSENYSLSEKAIHALEPKDLENITVQLKLLESLNGLDFGRKKRILELFGETSQLFPETVEQFNSRISDMEIPLKVLILEIFKEHEVVDGTTLHTVNGLAHSGNPYISRKAKEYLAWSGNKKE